MGNPLIQPQTAPPAASGPSLGQPPPNALQGAPAPSAPPPTPEQIADAHKHSDVMVRGLLELTAKPPGDLTKQDVFKEAADMIAKGGFSTPASRQQLIAELAQLPDDEAGIRRALGQFLMQAAQNQTLLLHHFGPPQGAPNAP